MRRGEEQGEWKEETDRGENTMINDDIISISQPVPLLNRSNAIRSNHPLNSQLSIFLYNCLKRCINMVAFSLISWINYWATSTATVFDNRSVSYRRTERYRKKDSASAQINKPCLISLRRKGEHESRNNNKMRSNFQMRHKFIISSFNNNFVFFLGKKL